MSKKLCVACAIALIGMFSLGPSGSDDKKEISAYVVKVIHDVNLKSPTTGWQKAVPLSKLKSGYEVKTDKNSLAMILFADQSKLILREKSIVTITGEVKGKEILSRSVHMDRGNMVFNVHKGETEQFRFSSPISVASIRGTQGGYNTGGAADSLTISEGLADFTNFLSGKHQPVGTGQTGVADSSGNLGVHTAGRHTLDNIHEGQHWGEQSDTSGGTGSTNMGSLTPDFGHLKSKHAGTVRVNLSSFQGKAISASLFYRKQGEQTFTELLLTITGQIATGKLPDDKVKYPKLEYYVSVKLQDNSITIVPQDGISIPAVVPVEPVQRELRIPGQTAALQKKVIVLHWNE
ncbi:MAG TPA: FecR domain-containing protein [Bacteroidota bacterium]|nr:FecR domain-containing protein [Bacteroidota bacterium]